MNFLKLVRDEISIEEIVNLVKSPACGAVSFFIGTTRNNFNGLKVKYLEYDAYEGMALREMEKICFNMRKKWPSIVNIAIYHRLGEVGITEASVVIAVSSPHRVESLDGVSFAINTLKTAVPIWKKEQYSNCPGMWKVNKECDWSSNCIVSHKNGNSS